MKTKIILFLGTEFGAYFTLNGGTNWHKIAGPPTIAFRDIKIQRRDNDLVGATFGRGFYVLDDYSALRSMAESGFGDGPTDIPHTRCLVVHTVCPFPSGWHANPGQRQLQQAPIRNSEPVSPIT